MTQVRDDRLEPALVRLIAVVLLGGMLGILNSTMVAVAIDPLSKEFDTSLNTIGWASTGFLLAVTAMIPFTSWAVDRFGSKRMWITGLLLFLGGSLACALAWDVGSLIAFRAVQGVGAGILDPLVLVLLARAAGPSRAGRVMGLMGVVLSLGPVLGPIAGGAILEGLSWRWMFLLSLPVGLIALLLAVKVVPADPPRGSDEPFSRLDVIGLALLGPAFAVLVLAMTQSAERVAFATWQVLTPLILGVVMLLAYGIHALRERRSTPPLIDLRLFKNTSFTASVTVMTLSGLATFASLFALPLYYQQAHGLGTFASGLLVTPIGLGAALAMPLAGSLSDKMGSRGLAQGGAVVTVLGAFCLTQVSADTSVWLTSIAALVVGLGLGFVGAPTMGALYRTLPGHLVPQGSSVLYMLNQLGAAIGIALVTVILKTIGDTDVMKGIHGVYWFAIGTLAVLLVATLFLPGRIEATPTAVGPPDDEPQSAPGQPSVDASASR
ncbi:DHA2 family efflux MFS transporter permease subunit [Streptomyces sp. NPDC057376]|uniref:DHA2 family efflux MFS transporter permease subunit n=1 Tax=unclassified Streptomyces TaxID=2593676 RepID=UPI00093A3640|nr:DHA2 family efflux MFS transporter permease subunit [Streptomyces sp. CB02414]OKI81366.1 EmrB/QacA family drug resistance transporter [Streptomyces sp. CB02414]